MKNREGIWVPENETPKWWTWTDKYDEKEYNKLNLSGDVCLDIGAHIGLWTKKLSKDFNQVICFEPLQEHIDCHKKNCKELDNITLHECALSDSETDSIMTTNKLNSGMSTLLEPNWEDKDTVIVKTKTLDSFNLPKVDFIKIDVEGYELQVLSGGRETITKYKPKIYIEISNSNLRSATYILNEIGYSLIQTSKNVDSINQNYLAVVK
tara:strand:+ start:113 stop:739 length:627 start_codon:yes stop_codon:yes gene_type:complete